MKNRLLLFSFFIVFVAVCALAKDKSEQRLTEKDYIEVAKRLDVEVAAIKAVVEIETGRTHKGFWEKGKPLVNFDYSVLKKFAPKRKVKLSECDSKLSKIKGSKQQHEQARVDAICSINEALGYESAFWGMFQIGGFNWKLCKTKDIHEFMDLMSRSERDQLELFANFIESTKLVKYLKAKNWAGFASRYNGPSYESRGYHTRMAKAYEKYKNK